MYPRVEKKHYQILKRLIKLGADVNAKVTPEYFANSEIMSV